MRSNDICFLGILRSLASCEVPVVPIVFSWDSAPEWYSEKSRYFKNPRSISNPFEAPGEALCELVAIGKDLASQWGEKLLLIPSSDTNLMFILENYDELKDYFKFIGGKTFEENRIDVIDKFECYQSLEKAGVCLPKTIPFVGIPSLEEQLKGFRFPCVFKPRVKDYGQSFYRHHGGYKAVPCDDKDDLISKLKYNACDASPLIIQEKVFFDSALDEIPIYVYADRDHNVRLWACAVKEKIQPYPFGTATVLRIVQERELLALAEEVVRALAWRGLLMIEFIKDQRDGQWKVIEVNGRPWLFIDFFRRSGFNFLKLLYDDCEGVMYEKGYPNYLDLSPDDNVHISLSHILSEESDRTRIDASYVKRTLQSIEGRKSLTYLDPDDPSPGEAEINHVMADASTDCQGFINAVKGELSSY